MHHSRNSLLTDKKRQILLGQTESAARKIYVAWCSSYICSCDIIIIIIVISIFQKWWYFRSFLRRLLFSTVSGGKIRTVCLKIRRYSDGVKIEDKCAQKWSQKKIKLRNFVKQTSNNVQELPRLCQGNKYSRMILARRGNSKCLFLCIWKMWLKEKVGSVQIQWNEYKRCNVCKCEIQMRCFEPTLSSSLTQSGIFLLQ